MGEWRKIYYLGQVRVDIIYQIISFSKEGIFYQGTLYIFI